MVPINFSRLAFCFQRKIQIFRKVHFDLEKNSCILFTPPTSRKSKKHSFALLHVPKRFDGSDWSYSEDSDSSLHSPVCPFGPINWQRCSVVTVQCDSSTESQTDQLEEVSGSPTEAEVHFQSCRLLPHWHAGCKEEEKPQPTAAKEAQRAGKKGKFVNNWTYFYFIFIVLMNYIRVYSVGRLVL